MIEKFLSEYFIVRDVDLGFPSVGHPISGMSAKKNGEKQNMSDFFYWSAWELAESGSPGYFRNIYKHLPIQVFFQHTKKYSVVFVFYITSLIEVHWLTRFK